jgi:transcriptional regulator with XRE-family HTH domain
MGDPEYKREFERTKLANDVAVRVLAYRTKHRISQAELARRLGMRQPNIARLESGEHEPSLSTLARLSLILGLDFSIDIKGGGLKLRQAPRPRKTPGARIAVCKVPAAAAVANASKRRGAWTLAARGGSRISAAEALAKAGGSGKVVRQGKRGAGREPGRTG